MIGLLSLHMLLTICRTCTRPCADRKVTQDHVFDVTVCNMMQESRNSNLYGEEKLEIRPMALLGVQHITTKPAI
jgi:hypothetical protein